MTTIDKRVLEVDFDNSNFEKNAQTSMNTLDQFEKKAQMKNASSGIDKLSQTLSGLTGARQSAVNALTGISGAAEALVASNMSAANSVDTIAGRFSNLGIIGMTVLSNLTTSAMGLVGNILGALPNAIISGGFNRALSMEQAKFTLQGILNDATAVANTLEVAKQSVADTAYTSADAAKAAATLAASGVTVEKGLSGVMAAIAGTTATVNGNYQSISQIFSTVASNGRLMTMQLRQFSSQGLNVSSTLQKVFQDVVNGTSQLSAESQKNIRDILTTGKNTVKDLKDMDLANITEKDINELVSASLINFQAFSDGMELTFGKHAKDANKTFTGSMANIRAALARTGEMFFTDLIAQESPLVEFFNHIRVAINGFNNAIKPIASVWSSTVNGMISSVNKVFEYLNTYNEFTSSLMNMGDLTNGGGTTNKLLTLAESIAEVVKTISGAYRDIFPAKTNDEILAFTLKIRDFFRSLTIGEETLDKIRRAAAGFFAVIKIIGSVIGTIASVAAKLLKTLSPIGGILLDISATIGDLLVKLSKAIDDASIFQKISDTISAGLEKIKEALTALRNAVGNGFKFLYGIYTGDPGAFDTLAGKMTTVGRTFQKLREEASKGKSVLKEYYETLSGGRTIKEHGRTALQTTAEGLSALTDVARKAKSVIGDNLSKLGAALSERLSNFDLGRALTFVAGVLQTLTMFNIVRFTAQITNAGKAISGFIGRFTDGKNGFGTFMGNSSIVRTINGTLNNLGVAFKQFGQTFKIKFIKDFSMALLMLAGALFVLSLIEPAKLAAATGAVTALIGELVGSLKLLSMITMGKGSLASLVPVMIGIGIAMVLLSSAVFKLSGLNLEELAKGIGGVLVLIASLIASLKLLQFKGGDFTAIAKAVPVLLAVAIAVRLLSGAVAKLGSIPFKDLVKGLGSIAVLLSALSASMVVLSKTHVDLRSVFILISIALAIKILSTAVEKLGSIPWKALVKGLGSIGALLAALTASTRLLAPKDSVSLLKASVYMLAVGAAMEILVDALTKVSNIPADRLMDSLFAVLSLLAALGLVTQLVKPQALLKSGASFIMIGIATEILANALMRIAVLDPFDIAKGLITIGGAMLIFAAAANVMGRIGMKGAGAVSMVGGALIPLAIGLSILAKIPLESVGSTLLLLAGTFTILGAAVKIFSKNILQFAAIGAILTGLGAAFILFGVGLAVIATVPIAGIIGALVGLAAAIAALALVSKVAEPFTMSMGKLVAILLGLSAAVALFGMGMYAASVAVVSFFSTAQLIVQYGGDFLAKVIHAVLQGIKDTALEIADTFGQLFLGLATALHKYAAPIANELLMALVDIINTIANNIGPLADALWNLGGALLMALWNGLQGIAGIAWDTITSFFEGLNIPQAISDMMAAGAQMIGGFFAGIGDFLLNNPVTQFFGGIVDGIKGFLGIGDEGGSTVLNEVGASTGEGFVEGINSVDATDAGAQLSQEALAGVTSGAEQSAATAAENVVSGFTAGMSDNTSTAEKAGSDVGEAAETGAGSVDFTDTAYNTVLGYAQGLRDNSYLAEDAMRQVANNAKTAANDTLGVRSPSRVLMETGAYTAQGFALGLLNNLSAVAKASTTLGQASINGISNAVNKANIYGIDFDATPTIRPVMDLTDIYAGVAEMSRLIGSSQAQGFASIGYNGANLSRNIESAKNVTYQLVLDGAVYNDVPEIENVVGNAFEIMGRYRGMNYG